MVDVTRRAAQPFKFVWQGAAQRATLSPVYRGYMLFLMAVIAMLAFIDRNILSVLLVPIKQDISASDTAMGLLGGLAFAVFYATAAIPVSRYADKGNRRNLVAGAVVLWSGATAICGLAGNYWHLLLARIGVATGEAASMPANMSMIADIFPPRRRATAIGLMMVGVAVGLFLGSWLGGVINDTHGWRMAFIILGVPGILVALIYWLTFPEPVRGIHDGGVVDDAASKTVGTTLRYLVAIPTFVPLVIAKCLLQMSFQGWLLWMPAFLIRVHGMSTAEAGYWFGLCAGGGAIFAGLIGGPVSDYLARQGARWYPIFCAGAAIVGIPLTAIIMLSGSETTVIALMFVYSVTTGTVTAPSAAAGLAIVRPRMRAFMTAVTGFTVNLAGAGLGPLVIGILSDLLRNTYGDNGFRYSLLLIPLFLGLSAALFLLAARTTDKDAASALRPAPVST